MVFKRPPNPRDLLVKANLYIPGSPTNAGNTTCNNKWCKTCPIIVSGNTFNSFVAGRKYNIKAHSTWKSRNLIYLISCKKCGVQNVGKIENPLHIQMNDTAPTPR